MISQSPLCLTHLKPGNDWSTNYAHVGYIHYRDVFNTTETIITATLETSRFFYARTWGTHRKTVPLKEWFIGLVSLMDDDLCRSGDRRSQGIGRMSGLVYFVVRCWMCCIRKRGAGTSVVCYPSAKNREQARMALT